MRTVRYLEPDGMWLLSAPEGFDCEVLVSGDTEHPHPGRLALVETAIPALYEIRSRGITYRESFLDRTKIAPGCDWILVGLESGRREDREDQLTLHYSIEYDTYGDWFVTPSRRTYSSPRGTS